ncbi:helix-turn-helix domain-containing protein [Roseovarius sp. EGI FJ00037]|uniref:GlxA family transcriptional regulator n=1 Tax=Roseovarius TaxID=74030 RepID=UPI0022A8B035|nr:helix-turn-helix domain-containing protein [Roseovarius sp. EGI FJ00037]MCZ0812013.1 helix-turn-helix domain-containing protein [Roseovarius sp. EGI FJ00037]
MNIEKMTAGPRIALLALPESTPAAIYGLYEVFLSAGRTWEQLTGEPSDVPLMTPRIVTADGAPVETTYGLAITPHEAMGEADIVIVTDLVLDLDKPFAGLWSRQIEWLREKYATGATVCSVCTGTAVLAEAGLLDGLEATTHWSLADLLRHNYPEVRLAAQKILVPAGPEHRIITGGGATAWEELALYLVARFCSPDEAVRIAKIFLFGDHSEGQLPFAGVRRPRRHDDAVISEIQGWIADNYHRANPVAAMVEQSGLTERTFMRRFRAATGSTPMEYVQTMRIEEAKHLLETSEAAIDQVAIEVGYEDSNFFRRLFKRRVGVTPARYRQRFSKLRLLGGRA